MGRKKIQISRITDERNRQVSLTLRILNLIRAFLLLAFTFSRCFHRNASTLLINKQ